jgi:hypothetical protein
MDFINQVKKLKELTKSPEVSQICESYLTGSSEMSESQVLAALNEQASNIEATPELKNHWDSIKSEQMDASRKAASALMESWGGLKANVSLNNAGSYLDKEKNKEDTSKLLLESLNNLASSDDSAKSFVDAQGLKNLGVLESINKLRDLSIYEYPKVKIVCEQYANIIVNKSVPEFAVIHNFISELEAFKWDVTVLPLTEGLKEKANKFSREIEVSKVLESIKQSGNNSFYSELSESLNNWLISESKSSGLLSKEITKWSFNPVVRNLINYLNSNEAVDSKKLEIPVNVQGESKVGRIYSPILIKGDKTIFAIGNSLFEAEGESFRKLSTKEVGAVPSDYIGLVNASLRSYVKINENGILIQLGKKYVSLVEENEAVSVYLGKSKLNFRSVGELGKVLGLESASHFAVNESQVVNDILNLYVNFSNIVELDFAKNITSNIYEGVAINLIKWNNEIYLQRINEGMRENSIYKVNGSQAVKMVKDYLRYDISEGLTEFLDGEQKIKSIMINDRTKVLENISRVEEQINKVESLMENNPLYAASKEIKSAHSLLNNELSVLREKWNQINIELGKVESTPEMEFLSEDEKFSLGDYIKVKESGETGKIISIDGSSGRYTILLDTGKTSDFLVNEISDLEEALSQAAEKNDDAKGEEEGGEVKESDEISRNLNKSALSEEEQKALLKTFADGHGFTKAPKGEGDEIKIELDHMHGYNLTVNEAKAKAATMAKAPGNNKKEKAKVEGEDDLAEAPETKDKTEFEGEDADGKNKEIGYNLREGVDANLVEAPGSGKEAKETKGTTSTNFIQAPAKGKSPKETRHVSSLEKFMNLAEAPGDSLDIEFDAEHIGGKHKAIGYNLDESNDLKKN